MNQRGKKKRNEDNLREVEMRLNETTFWDNVKCPNI